MSPTFPTTNHLLLCQACRILRLDLWNSLSWMDPNNLTTKWTFFSTLTIFATLQHWISNTSAISPTFHPSPFSIGGRGLTSSPCTLSTTGSPLLFITPLYLTMQLLPSAEATMPGNQQPQGSFSFFNTSTKFPSLNLIFIFYLAWNWKIQTK